MHTSLDIPSLGTHMAFLSSSAARLVLSAVLGGVIGLERTIHHKTAGIRTNMFICLGAAMFAVMSDSFPDSSVSDRTRIASNIVQGVGFLGAGAILHGKGGVQGLTTAATMWVVASIGMACGAGKYLVATFATILILVALAFLGRLEASLGLKVFPMSYEVKGQSAPVLLEALNEILEDAHHSTQGMQVGRSQGLSRVIFRLTCSLPEHRQILEQMKTHPEFESVTRFSQAVEE